MGMGKEMGGKVWWFGKMVVILQRELINLIL